MSIRAEVVSPFVAIPAALDMGTLQLGQSYQAVLDGRNLLLRPITVQVLQSSTPEVTVAPQTATIPASSSAPFTVTVTPQRLGSLVAELRFLVSDPCLDTHRVVLQASVVGEGLTHTSFLDFGSVAFCQERGDTVSIDNGTADTVWLLEARLSGADAAAFVAEFPALPVGIAPGESLRFAVVFRPLGLSDGVKQAQIELVVRVGTELRLLGVQLSGRRETPLLSAPLQVSFGTVLIGASARQPVTVTNQGSASVRVDRLWLGSGQAFAIVQQPALPAVVAPGESLLLTVEFHPVQEGSTTDTLYLRLGEPCADERVLLLSGIGVRPVAITVWFPELEATPWEERVRIPLYVESSGAIPGQRWGEVECAYDASLFLLRGVSRGRILRQGVNGGLRSVVVRVENVELPGDGVMTELIGDVLLGSREESPLRVVGVLWDDGILSGQTRTRDGQLRLVGICQEGGPRLLRPVGRTWLTVRAEHGTLQIVTEAGERGAYALEVCSLEGRCLPVASWTEAEAGVHVRQWEVARLPAGVYSVRFRTPTMVRSVLVPLVP